ncbi:MAG: response regulator transcription factor [Saprospiraceae bacterium]|nr:response regulator transcription factor [Saprospiraceae bacterium]MCB0576456.1 response regulator transcription factor [Saprospiraceae bacterium]MCB9305527.1 response regulator transcription factor [Lewinellaceae bacterium]
MKILLIEDEPELAAAIAGFFRDEGFLVELAADYPAALEKALLYEYDCLIVDINLPGGGSGLDVIRALKKSRPDAAVIIVTARNALDDRIAGLDLGADDYLIKPFHLPELNARLKALLRRRYFGGNADIVFHDIRVDPDRRSVFVQGSPIDLTPKEYNLLLYFLANRHRVLRRESIAEYLLGDAADQMDDFNFIYSHIKNLRKKLLEGGCEDYLQAIYGIGYKFTDEK